MTEGRGNGEPYDGAWQATVYPASATADDDYSTTSWTHSTTDAIDWMTTTFPEGRGVFVSPVDWVQQNSDGSPAGNSEHLSIDELNCGALTYVSFGW